MVFHNIFSSKEESKEKTEIKIDNREKNSLVPSELIKREFMLKFIQLPIGDYLINNIAIERKTISDLKSSIIDKRIFNQLNELKQYPLPLLIIEGNYEELFNNVTLSSNAIRGFLLSVQTNYKVPLIFSGNEKETATYISLISKKKRDKEVQIRVKKRLLDRKEKIQFILEGFPNIGPKKAKGLMKKFGSLKKVMNANEKDLFPILGKKTKEFKSFLD